MISPGNSGRLHRGSAHRGVDDAVEISLADLGLGAEFGELVATVVPGQRMNLGSFHTRRASAASVMERSGSQRRLGGRRRRSSGTRPLQIACVLATLLLCG